MSKLENLSIESYIRIHNYHENDNGMGRQIIRNDLENILDMQDNFNWSDKDLMKFIKSNKFKINSKWLDCGNCYIESVDENDIKNYVLKNILNHSLNSELREIVVEEMCNNCEIGIYTCDNNWEDGRIEKCLGE